MGKQMQEKREARKAGRARKWPWILGGVVVLLVLIVLLIPVALSSRGFTQWVEGTISRSTGGQTNIGNLSIGWLKGIHAANFQFRGENGWTQVDIDRITTQPSFSSLLGGTLALDRTVIDQPRITIDLRERPVPTKDSGPVDMNNLSRLNDLVVRNGSVQLIDTTGRTVQVTDLDSTLNMRSPGRTSRFDVSLAVAQAQGPAEVRASGEVTPNRQTGWSLRGTSGEMTIEVNDLNLASVAPFLEMAGVQVEANGQVSANITGNIQDGQIQNLSADVQGQNLNVTGEALKGDRLQTSKLNVQAEVTRTQDRINVEQLNVQTDWATASAAGGLPTTVKSLAELLGTGAASNLTGQFDINLAALLSQMPNTLGVREGMEITGGRATGNIRTETQAGRGVLVADAQVAGLEGVVDGKKLSLSEPVRATARLSSDAEGAQLQGLTVTAPFATVNASGDFEQIKYDGQIDLGALQSELGAFINLGEYKMAGQATSQGQVSIQDEFIGTSGSLSVKQLVVTLPDGNSVSQQAADVDFALGLDRKQQVLTVDRLTANTDLGTVNVAKATVPLAEDTQVPLNVNVSAQNVDLARLKPYAVMFASFPQEIDIAGIAQAPLTITRQQGLYRIFTDATRIQNFRLVSPQSEPLQQDLVTAMFDVYIDPNQKAINLERLQVESPLIRIRKGAFTRTTQNNTARFQGTLDAQWDLAAVGQVVSAVVPGTVILAGQRQVSANFASTYPVNEPNALLANLDGQASLGFDRAEYMGLNFGPTDVNVVVQDGLMNIEPFTTTVNEGQFRFAAEAALRQTPTFLRTPAPLQMAKGIQINEQTTEQFLKYVNPIFANAVSVSGILNFESQTLAIPLMGNDKRRAELTGTLSIQELRLGASGLLNQILGVIGESVSGQTLTIRPTKIALQNGVLRYDDMQIDVGDNPVNFSGAIGLDGILDMTVVLPYTYEGRTARIDDATQRGRRVSVPLTGTLDKPQINLQKLVESQLQEQILKGLEDLFD